MLFNEARTSVCMKIQRSKGPRSNPPAAHASSKNFTARRSAAVNEGGTITEPSAADKSKAATGEPLLAALAGAALGAAFASPRAASKLGVEVEALAGAAAVVWRRDRGDRVNESPASITTESVVDSAMETDGSARVTDGSARATDANCALSALDGPEGSSPAQITVLAMETCASDESPGASKF